MSFNKFTLISTPEPGFDPQTRNGHWDPAKAANVLRRKGCTAKVLVEHCVADLSGKGRDGHDGRFVVTPDDAVTRVARFSEFGREHA